MNAGALMEGEGDGGAKHIGTSSGVTVFLWCMPSRQLRVIIVILGVILFVSSVLAQRQLDEADFESWTNVGMVTQEPSNWSSLKSSDAGAFINALVPQLCWRSADAHSGSYSVELRTVNSAAGTANGLLTNGRVHAELNIDNSYMYTDPDDTQWNTIAIGRPDSLVGWYKADPQVGDRANIGALLHVDEGRLPAFGTEANYIAGASWKAPYQAVPEWTRFSTPFQYLDERDPEWVLLILTSGDSAGSVIGSRVWFDDLALIYNVQCTMEVAELQLAMDGPTNLQVAFSTQGPPMAPVQFRVELSDADGGFSQPVNLGTLTTNAAQGMISCQVPAGVPPGTGYQVRVNTSSPYYAPIPVGLPLVIATGVGGPAVRNARIWASGDAILCDLRGSSWNDAYLEVYDSNGRMIERRALHGGSLHAVAIQASECVLLLRVTHQDGVWSGRVVMP